MIVPSMTMPSHFVLFHLFSDRLQFFKHQVFLQFILIFALCAPNIYALASLSIFLYLVGNIELFCSPRFTIFFSSTIIQIILCSDGQVFIENHSLLPVTSEWCSYTFIFCLALLYFSKVADIYFIAVWLSIKSFEFTKIKLLTLQLLKLLASN